MYRMELIGSVIEFPVLTQVSPVHQTGSRVSCRDESIRTESLDTRVDETIKRRLLKTGLV